MDENYQCLKDEATKTKQALENAFTEKEVQKKKIESIYKSLSKTEDELKTIFLEIESDRKNTGVPLHEEYNDAYWKWKDADEANEKAQTSLKKYDENYNADIPDVMIELKEVKQQNEEMQRQNEELKNKMEEMTEMLPQMMMQQNEELKNKMKELLQEVEYVLESQNEVLNRKLQELQCQNEELKNKMEEMMMQEELEQQRQEELKRQRQEELERQRKFKNFSKFTPAFNRQNKEVDFVFPEPVEARYITFKPKAWNSQPFLRCEVYVDNVLQNTPLNQRSFSSAYNESCKDSTMNAEYGWKHKEPYNANEWLKLDLQQRKTITGIRVGTGNHYGNTNNYVSKFALEFEN